MSILCNSMMMGAAGPVAGEVLWLDSQNTNTLTTAYQNLTSTVTGTSGLSSLVCSADESLNVFIGMTVRANGADVYTVSNVATSVGITTITVSGTLSSNYSGSALAVLKISQQNDRSVNGNNAIQGTATKQPIYRAAGLNGDSVVNFGSSTTTVLSIASSTTVTNLFSGGGTAFIVFNARSTGGGGGGRIFDKTTGSGGWQIITNNASGATFKLQFTQVYGTGNGQFVTSSAIASTNTNYILCITYDSSSTANVPTMLLNGGSALTLTNTAPTGSFVSDSGSALLVGNNPGGIRQFDGFFGDILIYPTILSTAQIKQVNAELGAKFGIAVT